MAYLTAEELPQYFPAARNMDTEEVALFLQRANSYAFGIIGGYPPAIPGDDGTNLKAAVALAFEILTEGETAQVDPTNGNITEAAPTRTFNRSDRNAKPLATVDTMLTPYKRAYEEANAPKSDTGVLWLGG